MTDFPRIPVKVLEKERVFNGFFKIDQLHTVHDRYSAFTDKDGKTHSQIDFNWLIFERGYASAVVLYRTDTQEVVLVRQFRAPTLKLDPDTGEARADSDGQLIETIAGMPKDGETPQDAIIRETLEETGYEIKQSDLKEISRFYVSPGGTSERIFLYYAEVTAANRTGADSEFIERKTESIQVLHIPVSEFFTKMVQPDQDIDSKVLIASLLLREILSDVSDEERTAAAERTVRYRLKAKPNLQIVLRAGDIMNVRDVDAWINPENTDMEMDRYVGRTVSAKIRYHGAAKDDQERVIEDTIGDALRSAMGSRRYSRPGTVHETTPGELRRSHKVKRLFHVAAMEGQGGKGVLANSEHIEDAVRKSLTQVEKRNRGLVMMGSKCASALSPIIGVDAGELAVEVAFPQHLKGVLAYFRDHPTPVLREAHICAVSRHDAVFAEKELDQHPDLERI